MKFKVGSLCLISLCFFSSSPVKGESLNSVAFEILTGSPGFRSDTYALESVVNGYKTESNLPDPEIGGEYLWMPDDVDNRWALDLTWGLEWPGVYGARGKQASEQMTAAEKRLYAQRVAKLAEIKDILLDFIQCRIKLALLEDLNRNNDTIYRLAEQAARGGEMTVLDLNKVRLEYANIRVAKAALMDVEASLVTSLAAIYGRDCRELLGRMDCVFPELEMPSEFDIEKIKDLAPEMIAAKAEAEVARRAKSVAKMEALPNISIGYKHAFEDAMHFNGILFGVSIPIFSSRGKQKAANAAIIEAETRAEAVGDEISSDAMQTLRRLELLQQQINEIAPIVESADYNSALLKAYQGGVITLIEYISDRNYFTSAAIELVSLRLSAAKAVAQLQRLLDPVAF